MTKQGKQPQKSFKSTPQNPMIFEAEVIEGLEEIAQRELHEKLAAHLKILSVKRGSIQFSYTGNPSTLLQLRTIQAVYSLLHHPVPRPRGLLGHEHFHKLLRQIDTATSMTHPISYHTLSIGAAGAESSVMQRLLSELTQQTKLETTDEKGDLLIRIRRPPDKSEGWQTLVRLSPRPLGTRAWRVRNLEGALNGTVAHAMILLTQPAEDDVFANPLCGSGTFLIERANLMSANLLTGCDLDAGVLVDAQTNIQAANYAHMIHLQQSDASQLPYADASVDALCADLPFGQLVGSHEENLTLYPIVLAETARIAHPDAHFALITHEIRLIERLLSTNVHWKILQTLSITLNGLHPRIYLLKRNAAR